MNKTRLIYDIKDLANIFQGLERRVFTIKVYLETTKWGVDEYISHINSDKESGRLPIHYYDDENHRRFERGKLSEFVYSSIIALLWSSFEGLLRELVILFEKKNGKVPPDKKILCFWDLVEKLRGYGLDIDEENENYSEIKNLYTMRNNFIHSLVGYPETGDDLKGVNQLKSSTLLSSEYCEKAIKSVEVFVQEITSSISKLP